MNLVFKGFLIIAFVVTLHGRMGSLYHIPFPVLNRAPWGINGVYCTLVYLRRLTPTGVSNRSL